MVYIICLNFGYENEKILQFFCNASCTFFASVLYYIRTKLQEYVRDLRENQLAVYKRGTKNA